MTRSLVFIGALLAASFAGSSASLADAGPMIRFTLEPQHGNPTKIHANFRHQGSRGDDNQWSNGFMPSDLIGLEVSSFHGSGTRPIHFSIVREAGRLDCSGNGGHEFATGTCRFTPDPGFGELLVRSGAGRPTYDESLGLTAVNARRELVEALTAAHYPAPRINDLMALAALGVDGRYIADLSRAGYRPPNLQKLVEFKALGITPAWIGGFVRIGYANVPGDGLVQLRALGISPEYILGFEHLGYRNLPVNTLVQLKALGITPEFVRSVATAGQPMPPVNKLVEMKVFSRRH
ncbi:MAG TPA: hypothetical protein VE968_03980 [Sphingomicrobium sp.]|nr:hypothetical protein [Sphingomicrobium sp.]